MDLIEKRRFLDVVDIKEEYVKEDLRIQHYVIRRVSHLPVYSKTICSPLGEQLTLNVLCNRRFPLWVCGYPSCILPISEV